MNVIWRSYLLNFRSLSVLPSFRSRHQLLNAVQTAALDKFVISKEKAKLYIKNPNEYKQTLLQASASQSRSFIFTDDIKNIVTLAETDEDLDLLKKVLLKFSSQKNIIPYNSFYFGPEIMRLLYLMNKPSEALSLVQNPNLAQYFQHKSTFILLLNLLIKNNLYKEVITISEQFAQENEVIPTASTMHYFLSCYMLNTETSLKKAKSAWNAIFSIRKPPVRLRLIFSLILLKHGLSPFEVYSFSNTKFDSLLENVKCMILARGNRFQDVFRIIREVLDSEDVKKFVMCEESLSFIEKEVQNSNESDIIKFFELKEELKKKNIIIPVPLDTFLFGTMNMQEVARQIHSKQELSSIIDEQKTEEWKDERAAEKKNH